MPGMFKFCAKGVLRLSRFNFARSIKPKINASLGDEMTDTIQVDGYINVKAQLAEARKLQNQETPFEDLNNEGDETDFSPESQLGGQQKTRKQVSAHHSSSREDAGKTNRSAYVKQRKHQGPSYENYNEGREETGESRKAEMNYRDPNDPGSNYIPINKHRRSNFQQKSKEEMNKIPETDWTVDHFSDPVVVKKSNEGSSYNSKFNRSFQTEKDDNDRSFSKRTAYDSEARGYKNKNDSSRNYYQKSYNDDERKGSYSQNNYNNNKSSNRYNSRNNYENNNDGDTVSFSRGNYNNNRNNSSGGYKGNNYNKSGGYGQSRNRYNKDERDQDSSRGGGYSKSRYGNNEDSGYSKNRYRNNEDSGYSKNQSYGNSKKFSFGGENKGSGYQNKNNRNKGSWESDLGSGRKDKEE